MKNKKKNVTFKIISPIDMQTLLEKSFFQHKKGDLACAKDGYEKILSVDPHHVDALQLLGKLAREQERFEDAIELIKRAICINPNVAVFHHNLAETYHVIGKTEDAINYYREAIRLDSNYVSPQINLGAILQSKGSLSEALKLFKTVVAICPDHVLGQYNLASCARSLGRDCLALKHCNDCLLLDSSHVDANLLKAGFLLSEGLFEEGWKRYEWRRYQFHEPAKSYRSIAPFPRWNGSSLTDKRILLQAEQGLGDEIMFSSCVSNVADMAGDCLLECDSRLVSLFSRSFPKVSVLPRSSTNNVSRFLQNGPVDWQITTASLPNFYRKSLADFRGGVPYLVADSHLKKCWRERLSLLDDGLNVGISWRGGRDVAEQQLRSIPLLLWKSVFEISSVNFINLQYGDHAEEISRVKASVDLNFVSFPEYDPLDDLENAAALIAELDLVITIDNSTAHLAGALGTSVWLLLPCGSNWRWMKGCSDNYWYNSLKIFHQEVFGEKSWVKVVEDVAQCLESKLSEDCMYHADLEKSVEKATLLMEVDHEKRYPKFPQSKRRALLLNDTSSWYHWGCSCTSIAIHQQLEEKGLSVTSIPINAIMAMSTLPTSVDDFDSEVFWEKFRCQHIDIVQAIEQSEVVVVNGEGSLHGLGSLPLKLLFLMYFSRKSLNTPVHLINHSCYPFDNNAVPGLGEWLYKKVYDVLDFCGVREIKSALLLGNLGISAKITFDCMPLFISRNYLPKKNDNRNIVISGSVSFNDNMLDLFIDVIPILITRGYNIKLLIGADAFPAVEDLRISSALGNVFPESFQVVNANSEMEWLTTICQSRLLISGRFHHSIAAACLKTPFIALETNTPKLDALLEMLSLSWKVVVSNDDASEKLTKMAEVLLANPEKGIISDQAYIELQSLSSGNFEGLK